MEELYELMDEYAEAFGDNFPHPPTDQRTDEKIAALIRECLDRGEPYDPHWEQDCDY